MRGDSQALYTLCSSTLQKWLIQSDVGKACCVSVHVLMTAVFILLKTVEI